MQEQSTFLTQDQAQYVFKQLIADYGLGAIKSKWETLTARELQGNIARRLGVFPWDVVLWGLDQAVKDSPTFPPSIPDIAKKCEAYPKPQEYYQALPAPTITHEEAERRKREMEAAAQKIAAKKPGREWAMKIMADPKYFPAYSVMLARAALNEAD